MRKVTRDEYIRLYGLYVYEYGFTDMQLDLALEFDKELDELNRALLKKIMTEHEKLEVRENMFYELEIPIDYLPQVNISIGFCDKEVYVVLNNYISTNELLQYAHKKYDTLYEAMVYVNNLLRELFKDNFMVAE